MELLNGTPLRGAAMIIDGPRSARADDIDSWVRHHTGDWFHATGTCRMGPGDDRHAVVDTTCAVIGYNNLWVIDASVLPSCTTATTAVAVTAVAHRAAEWLARSS